jgi:hypothetical protein
VNDCPPSNRPLLARPRLVAFGAFVLLAVAHTWPLASNIAHLSRNNAADGALNAWAVAWVAHQLPRNPAGLFEANAFYPEHMTLAYSEALVVQGAMAVPIVALGGSAVLAYNVVLIAGFALTGWAFCLMIHAWTGSWAGAYVGGSLAAFNTQVLVRLAHLQAQHLEFVPLMLVALDRLVTSRRVRDAALLGIGFALQGLTSVYLLVFSTWAILFAVLARASDWLRHQPIRVIALLAVAGALASALLAPYLYGYYRLHEITGFERTVGDGQAMAASWLDYVSTGSNLHYNWWSYRFFDFAMSPAFPGVVAPVLAALAYVWPETRRDRRLWMCTGLALGCLAVSLLPRTPVYPIIFPYVPLFKAVRVPAHLGQFVLMMLGVAAGYGVAGIARRWWPRRGWIILAGLMLAGVNLEALRAPIGYVPFDGIPGVYKTVADDPSAVLVELPFYQPSESFRNARYMVNSTSHWRPILNGYSGFRPGSYDATYAALREFPSDTSLAALHDRGVTHVVVHADQFRTVHGDERFAAIASTGALRELAHEGDITVYRLK